MTLPRTLYRQQGIALVMVLWLLVLMTVIASSHSSNVRTETRLAFNHLDHGKARNLAEAGVYHAIMELLVADNLDRWSIDGSINRIRLDESVVLIAVRDVRGLVDINTARAAVLDPLFAAAGIDDSAQRQALVSATLDWRDKDKLRSINGAEDDDYRSAGLNWAARDGAFTSIEEFRYVLGMTNALFERLAPYLTVHSGQPNVRREFAPPWLIEVFGNNSRTLAGGSAGSAPAPNSTVHVTTQATTSAGTTASVEAVVKMEASKESPYTILSWRSPAARPLPASTQHADHPSL